MGAKRLATAQSARSGHLHPLAGPAVGLHLRHGAIPLLRSARPPGSGPPPHLARRQPCRPPPSLAELSPSSELSLLVLALPAPWVLPPWPWPPRPTRRSDQSHWRWLPRGPGPWMPPTASPSCPVPAPSPCSGHRAGGRPRVSPCRPSARRSDRGSSCPARDGTPHVRGT